MRQFTPLYLLVREASEQGFCKAGLGTFLAFIDEPVLDALAQRFDAYALGALDGDSMDDLIRLSTEIARDTGTLTTHTPTLTSLLSDMATGVSYARLVRLGVIEADIATFSLGVEPLATPTDLGLMALGGASQLRGAVLH